LNSDQFPEPVKSLAMMFTVVSRNGPSAPTRWVALRTRRSPQCGRWM